MRPSLTGLFPTRRESSPRYIVTSQIRLGVAVSRASKRNRAFWLNYLSSTCNLYKLRQRPSWSLHISLHIQSTKKIE